MIAATRRPSTAPPFAESWRKGGPPASTYIYESFGGLLSTTGTVANPVRYTGREYDAETGMYYYRARYYDPTTGRFLNEDPLQFTAGMNFYEYSYNNPATFNDPSGQQAAAPVVVTGSAAATGAGVGATLTYTEIGGSTAGPIGALIGLNVGLLINDSIGFYDLGVVYGWWGKPKPKPTPQPDTACKKGKWHCIAKCHINNFSQLPNIPSFVTGEGWGNSRGEAELAAEKDANTKVPRGTYKRHCSFKCEQR